jgi:hypothetical protein
MIRFHRPACQLPLQHPTVGDKVKCPNSGQRMQVHSPATKKETVLGTRPVAGPPVAPPLPVAEVKACWSS